MSRRELAASSFSQLLDIPLISRLVQRGRDPELARYTLELADGRTVRIGTIKNLWSQAELAKVMAVAIGCVPYAVDQKDWRNAIRALIVNCTDVEETPNETFEATVAEWVAAYSSRATTDRDGAAPNGQPFTDAGDLHLTANSLAKYIRREYSEQIRLHDLRQALRDIGFEQVTVHYTRKTGKATKRSSTSYYKIAQSTLDGDTPASDIILLTVDQAARIAQVSTRTVMRAIDNGHLRASQLADRGCWRIQPDDMDAWIEHRANRPRHIQPVQPTPTIGPTRPGRKTSRRISDLLTDDMGRDQAA